jgi:hypothetical protein
VPIVDDLLPCSGTAFQQAESLMLTASALPRRSEGPRIPPVLDAAFPGRDDGIPAAATADLAKEGHSAGSIRHRLGDNYKPVIHVRPDAII